MTTERNERTDKRTIVFRIIACIGIIGLGVFSMKILAGMNTPPAEKVITEKALQVEVIPARLENAQTRLTGYGEVRPLNMVTLSPENPGRVVMVHPRLEQGERIRKGEVLFRMDTESDSLSFDIGRKRLVVLKRNLELARIEYRRTQNLFKENRIGTELDIEKAEQSVNSLLDQVRQLELSVKTAEVNLNRATVLAPFDARIKRVSVEKGQYLSPGFEAVTLADDSILELQVALDSEKAMRLLQTDSKDLQDHQTPISRLRQVPVRVTWIQGDDSVYATGELHRILGFDAATRTLKVAVRVDAATQSQNPDSSFRIAEGMFCRVEIPGKTLANVVRVPQEILNPDNSIHIVSNNRLKTVPVTIGNADGDEALITSGLTPDDMIIVTRLSAPMENSLVEAMQQNQLTQSVRR